MSLSYQEVLVSSIGDFGRVQGLIVFACNAPEFIGAWSMIMMSFAGAQPDWWKTSVVFNITSNTTDSTSQKEACPTNVNETIVFDKSIYTIVSEWNLVCSRKWIPTVITTSQMVGVLLGAAVVGQLGDWFGRRKCLIGAYAMELLSIFVQGFASSWFMMVCTAFCVGFSLGGYLVLVNIYMIEFLGTKWRTFAGVIPMWGLGVTFFGVAFKLLPNWRHLCMATGILGLPSLIIMLFMPPSIRWLFTHGRFDEGKAVVKRIAKRNHLPEPDITLLEGAIKKMNAETKSEVKTSYLTLLTHRSTRVISLLLAYMWFVQGFGYYGLTLGVSRLDGDITINMVLMGIGETCCMGFVWLMSKCFGRKYSAMIFLFSTSVTSFGITIAYFLSTTNFNLITNILALASRFCLSAAWICIIMFTTELYPTVVRSTGYGWASVCARIGGILAPQNKPLHEISVHIPFTLAGILTALSCFMCFFLTDTYSSALDDHMPEKGYKMECLKKNGTASISLDEKTTLREENGV